jgi:hypothetical protein
MGTCLSEAFPQLPRFMTQFDQLQLLLLLSRRRRLRRLAQARCEDASKVLHQRRLVGSQPADRLRLPDHRDEGEPSGDGQDQDNHTGGLHTMSPFSS